MKKRHVFNQPCIIKIYENNWKLIEKIVVFFYVHGSLARTCRGDQLSLGNEECFTSEFQYLTRSKIFGILPNVKNYTEI